MSAESTTRTGTSDRRNGQHDSGDQPVLQPQHLALIEGSGIAPDVARARGYRSCTMADDDTLREIGFTKLQRRFPGLLIPIYNAVGELVLHQYRPDRPRIIRKKARKYETPEGAHLALDVPPSIRSMLADPGVPLFITEGSRKADSAASRGLCCVAVLGVDGWRGANDLGGTLALADFDAIALNGRPIYLTFDSDVTTKEAVAKALARAKAYLEMRGALVKIIYLPSGPNGEKVGLDDPPVVGYSVDELMSLAEDVVREPERPAPTATATTFNLSETGNAERLVAHHGSTLRFCHPWGTWLCWGGRHWERDATATVRRWAKDVVRGIYAEAADASSPEIRRALAEWAIKSESSHARQAMVKLAESEPGIPIKPEQLDTDPFLFNVENGTLDLRTGKLHPHDPKNNITKLAPVRFDPKATAPRFRAFLEHIVPDAEVRTYLQRYLGYCLSADTSEQQLVFAYGSGGNGKSTLLTLMRTLLGDYAKQAAPELLIARRGERHPTELADLFGARLVTSIEVDEGKRLAETLVKQMTGGDPMKGRFMRADFFEWMPTHKLLLAANHQPEIRGTDWAIWRRIRLVPFTITIADDEKDSQLPAKLQAEAPGILNWLLEGCLDWQRQGLGIPEAVRAATEAYRAEQDVLADFLAELCIVHPTAESAAGALYRTYTSWCDARGEKPLSSVAFGKRLAERGFRSDRSMHARKWVGLRLRTPDDPDGEAPLGPSDQEEPPPETPTSGGHDAFDQMTHYDAEVGITETIYTRKPLSRKMRHNASSPKNASLGVDAPPSEAAEESSDTVPYTLVTDTAGLSVALPVLLAAAVVAIDVETAIAPGEVFEAKKKKHANPTAVDPRRGRLRLMQLAVTGSTYVIDAFAVQDLSKLAPLFAGPATFVAHNASFELGWLRAANLPLPARMLDTQLLAKIVDAGTFEDNHKPYGLQAVAARHLDAQVSKEQQLSDWSVSELSKEQIDYAARDASILLELLPVLQAAVREHDLDVTDELEHALLPIMADIEWNGMHFDEAQWFALAEHAARERDRLAEVCTGLFGRAFNPRSPRQCAEAFDAIGVTLPRTATGQPSTSKKILPALATKHPAIPAFLAWKAALTLISTFGTEEWRPSADGRLHASYYQIGTRTGRTAAGRPNLQQVPKSSEYRRCFSSPPGRTLVRVDLTLAQVCVAAELSGDEKLIAALNDGADIHAMTAAHLYGRPVEEIGKDSPERKVGKTIVFGSMFGLGVSGLLIKMAAEHIPMTATEADQFLRRFEQTWPQLGRWKQAQMGRSDPEIRSTLGRVRHVEPTERETVRANSPIQMGEADGIKRGMVLLGEVLAECPTARLVNFVHDELVAEVDEAEAPKLEALIRRCLEEGMRTVLTKVAIRMDITTSRTWAGVDA